MTTLSEKFIDSVLDNKTVSDIKKMTQQEISQIVQGDNKCASTKAIKTRAIRTITKQLDVEAFKIDKILIADALKLKYPKAIVMSREELDAVTIDYTKRFYVVITDSEPFDPMVIAGIAAIEEVR